MKTCSTRRDTQNGVVRMEKGVNLKRNNTFPPASKPLESNSKAGHNEGARTSPSVLIGVMVTCEIRQQQTIQLDEMDTVEPLEGRKGVRKRLKTP